ncbi:trypsin-like peptidase domain-containing protein [Streptomyces sp. G45]|uniref:trypsin-like peptidase domain-containing protein n=1 Tax=Streptomyces sp. G45 TaxID=3406627 RepID=UPI003C219FEF
MDDGKPTQAKPNWWSQPRRDAGPDAGAGTSAGAGEGSVTAGHAPAADGDPVADAEPTRAPEPTGTPGAERPRPLHDPDPYSTPPYGEPGPWAPAPPVQHPMATPSHGTPAYGAQPPTAPAHGTPAHGTPAHGVPAPTAPAPAAPAHGMPTPGPQGPGTAPASPPPADPYGAPAAGAQPPAAPTQAAHPAPADGTPAPSAPAAAPAPGAPAHGTPTPGVPGAPAPVDPWQRYDPWSAPLQQTGAGVDTVERRRKRRRRGLVLGAVVIALVAGGVGGVTGAYLEREGGFGQDVELPQAGAESQARPKDSVAGIAASALPGVVTLHVRGDDGAGTGTGFVLDGKGHILTNNHVVEPGGTGGEISVTFSGGETARAKVVGRDAGYDLAVVKVSGVRGLKPLPLGNSENVRVGDPVVAIGAPFDLANTVTSGIISAKERPITAGGEKGDGSDVSYVNALQTDAPINPGNSGGPLVDSKARVIGINSAIRSADGGSESDGGQSGSIGLGFAIPINQGKRVAEELINTGRATHPVIGVTIDKRFTGDGARIARESQDGGPAVNRGGPGDRAGLRPGDVITEVDGQRVHSGDELIVKVRAHRPKDRLELTVERDGDEREVTLVLGSASGD